MEKKSAITSEQRQYIIEHTDQYPREKLAKDAGVSHYTLYRVLRELGATNPHNPIRSLRCKEAVEKLWATHSGKEISELTGFSVSFITQWKNKLKLEHDEETKKRIRNKITVAAQSARANGNSHEKAAKTWKRRRKAAELLFLSGLPTGTKFKFRKYPAKVYKAIHNLTSKYDYFLGEDLYTVYYDEQTKRTPMEHLYTKRYKLKFEQA